MPRYIDADALEIVCFTDREGSFSDGVQWLLEYIDGLQSADVQPVRRGKWLDGYGFAGNHYDCFVCDQCKEATMVKVNYCPYCGAKMEK